MALLDAATAGDLAEVQRLLAEGADVNEKSDFQDTPLIRSAERGHTEVVRCLLEAGAEVNCPNNDNDDALCYAAFGGYMPVVKLLLEYGAELECAIASFENEDDAAEAERWLVWLRRRSLLFLRNF